MCSNPAQSTYLLTQRSFQPIGIFPNLDHDLSWYESKNSLGQKTAMLFDNSYQIKVQSRQKRDEKNPSKVWVNFKKSFQNMISTDYYNNLIEGNMT